MTFASDLETLASLRRDGLLTDTEYEEAKRALLPAAAVAVPPQAQPYLMPPIAGEVGTPVNQTLRAATSLPLILTLWAALPTTAAFYAHLTTWTLSNRYRAGAPVLAGSDLVTTTGLLSLAGFAFFVRWASGQEAMGRAPRWDLMAAAIGGAIGAVLMTVYSALQGLAIGDWASHPITVGPSVSATDDQLATLAAAAGWTAVLLFTQAALFGVAVVAFAFAALRTRPSA